MQTQKSDPSLALKIINSYQRNFPLVPAPYAQIADELGVTEDDITTALAEALALGLLSRIGAILRPGRAGVSTLAAMAVPDQQLQAVADIVNSYPEVNHNYEREGEVNLWFVLNARDEEHLIKTIEDIESQTGFAVMDLRLEEEFRIDLGFDLHPYLKPHEPENEPLSQELGAQP